jgi:hypothetical protein
MTTRNVQSLWWRYNRVRLYIFTCLLPESIFLSYTSVAASMALNVVLLCCASCGVPSSVLLIYGIYRVSHYTAILLRYLTALPIPVAARSKAWVCGRALAGVVGSNPAGCMHVCLLYLCCQVEVSASGWSLVQRCRTECGVSECDLEASTRRRSWPTGGGGI